MGTIKSKRMRWVGHVACTGKNRNVYWILVAKPGGHTQNLEYLGTDGTIILRWIFKKLCDGTAVIHLAQHGDKW